MSQTEGHNNVHFVGVARVAGQGIVIASYSYNSETDLAGVKQVLEQPNMQLSPGKHYSFSVGNLAWHLIAGIIAIHLFYSFVSYYAGVRRNGFNLYFNLRTYLSSTMRP